ncbi:pantoate--beta-alanine ligase [Erythrobacter sp. EC-HK427]|uniref:pantoate--beta-alanine ligase n=1 Tax=Erythrobacter sp. EC-HK427 TaxID=2038396 RepID=UPI001252FA7F|nr:pantoate--beta-alanine ligase [Erythrobacter sp. EC-HK427]VVT04393.1 Pantothenate synthetase [Erythrobacter sp. EC-HK427]
METVTTLADLRLAVDELRGGGATLALVPTMGALHEGHLTLMHEAAKHADHVIASIFVNPRQFGPNEDLDAYPRQMAEDSAKLAAEGVALLWAPTVEAMYPQGYATNISVAGVSGGLCGGNRPGHFDGVATVVCKLFNQVRPDMAFFGEKDWQQLAVIRRMARDLDLVLPRVEAIHGVPTVREADGLAMSSRNVYLSPAQREQARAIPESLATAKAMLGEGKAWAEIRAAAEAVLLGNGFASVDYFDLRDADSLELLASDNGKARLFAAARIGGTRLIDNVAVT